LEKHGIVVEPAGQEPAQEVATGAQRLCPDLAPGLAEVEEYLERNRPAPGRLLLKAVQRLGEVAAQGQHVHASHLGEAEMLRGSPCALPDRGLAPAGQHGSPQLQPIQEIGCRLQVALGAVQRSGGVLPAAEKQQGGDAVLRAVGGAIGVGGHQPYFQGRLAKAAHGGVLLGNHLVAGRFAEENLHAAFRQQGVLDVFLQGEAHAGGVVVL